MLWTIFEQKVNMRQKQRQTLLIDTRQKRQKRQTLKCDKLSQIFSFFSQCVCPALYGGCPSTRSGIKKPSLCTNVMARLWYVCYRTPAALLWQHQLKNKKFVYDAHITSVRKKLFFLLSQHQLGKSLLLPLTTWIGIMSVSSFHNINYKKFFFLILQHQLE